MFHQLLLPPPVQVTLPKEIRLLQEMGPRFDHTFTVFGSGPNFRMVVMFGGKKSILGELIAETTLLHLGECAVIRRDHTSMEAWLNVNSIKSMIENVYGRADDLHTFSM